MFNYREVFLPFFFRWNSDELRKEVDLLKEMVKAQGTGEEHQMYQQQVQGLQETKTLCK